jgi:hypothetical protein
MTINVGRRRVPRWIVVAALLTVGVLGFGSGACGSTAIPVPLDEATKGRIRDTHFAASVAVEPNIAAAYSDRLLEQLRATRLFDRVDAAGSFSAQDPPDLIASVARPIYGRATIPLRTALSLGIVPTRVEEEHGLAFVLRSRAVKRGGVTRAAATSRSAGSESAAATDAVPVEFSYRGPTTLGWWAIVENLRPDRTHGDVYRHPQFREAFALTIVDRRTAIDKMLERLRRPR